MKYRKLGTTEFEISEIGLGTWGMSGDWGPVFDEKSIEAIHKALDMGVNFIDTSDWFGDGKCEKLIGQALADRSEDIMVCTKIGNRLTSNVPANYTRQNILSFVDRSLKNLGQKSIDLLMLHCPPSEIFNHPQVFQVLDDLQRSKRIHYYGISVSKYEDVLKALEYPGIEVVNFVFNMFRQTPKHDILKALARDNIGIIARLPLASGLLSGKFNKNYPFHKGDHRNFNRHGQFFDRGETFSGVNYEKGLEAVEHLKKLVKPGRALAQVAIKWVLMHEEISCVIPGGKSPAQVNQNCATSEVPELNPTEMEFIENVYNKYFKEQIEKIW